MVSPRFVLLHSPLMGPLTWQAVAAELRRRGHAAIAPAWPRLSTVGEGFYETLSRGLAAQLWDDPEPLILVAHSGAGGLVGPLENWLATVKGTIFVDAIMQHPRRSWFDTAPAAMRDQLRNGAQMGELPSWDEWWPPGALEKLMPDDGLRGNRAEGVTGHADFAQVELADKLVTEGRTSGCVEGVQDVEMFLNQFCSRQRAEIKHGVIYCVGSVCTDRHHGVTVAGKHL